MSVCFSVVFLLDLCGACGGPDTSSQRRVVFIDERHLAIVTAVPGPRWGVQEFPHPSEA